MYGLRYSDLLCYNRHHPYEALCNTAAESCGAVRPSIEDIGGNDHGEGLELLESSACIGGKVNSSFRRESELPLCVTQTNIKRKTYFT